MKEDYSKELSGISKYLRSDANENAKTHLIYPLFKKLFGKDFKIESDAANADTYIEGKLVVELKSKKTQWLSGFYQSLHYSKKGLSYPVICVITKDFLGLWDIKDIPEQARKLASQADSQKAPNEIGKVNANKSSKALAADIGKSAFFRINVDVVDSLFSEERSHDIEIREFLKILKNLDSKRIQINTYDFIDQIEYLKKFYDDPLEAVHCFYGIVGFWDVTSMIVDNDPEDYDIQLVSKQTGRISEQIKIKPKFKPEFKKYIESRYIFTNEGSGLTVDYYFSRFDEVISRINPEYAKQHGIFFTDINLSKFALWYVHEYFEKKLSDNYIVFDPAGGSGNLVTSWKGHLKHKIVSELQPDLLKTIERRMRLTVEDDDDLLQAGYTIIPKTNENIGLNFLDRSATEYLDELKKALAIKHLKLDKPLAFLLNPPYKNTDENKQAREDTGAEYDINSDILELTGADAGKERYLAFLGQIVNIAKAQNKENADLNPVLLIFTPTSWLIPRPTFKPFRKEFDKYFKYENGFIVTSNEFFKLEGKWPLAFTIWTFKPNEKGNKNNIKLKDFSGFKHKDLAINWDASLKGINKEIKPLIENVKSVSFSDKSLSIKEWLGQKMVDFKRSPTKTEKESNQVYGGLPIKDSRRENKKTYGVGDSDLIGLMDNCTPVRIKNRANDIRFSKENNQRVYFRFDNAFLDVNKSKCLNGFPDQKGYCAYDLTSAQKTFTWFAITKAVNGKYPTWANQMDIWAPKISKEKEKYFYSLCFAFALAENRSVVTRFEKDNPIQGTPDVFVDNPFSPLNPDSFWSKILDKEIIKKHKTAFELVELVKIFYRVFAKNHCSSGKIINIGLDNEPYFKYFEYPDFLTPNSGIIQIKKYAELNAHEDLHIISVQISEKSKAVKEEIYNLLINDFNYFE
jgi:hypothetical protein